MHPGGTVTLLMVLIKADSAVPFVHFPRPVKVSGEYIANWLFVI